MSGERRTLLSKAKTHLALTATEDDEALRGFLRASVAYAEAYQHKPDGYYTDNILPPTAEQAVLMLTAHFYESRDGGTGGFFADTTHAAKQIWETVNALLRLERDWRV
jgi:hypothetical protein